MSVVSSLGDKAFKMFAALCAAGTIVGVTGLGVNIYYNTGKHRKPVPPPQPPTGDSDLSSADTDAVKTE